MLHKLRESLKFILQLPSSERNKLTVGFISLKRSVYGHKKRSNRQIQLDMALKVIAIGLGRFMVGMIC